MANECCDKSGVVTARKSAIKCRSRVAPVNESVSRKKAGAADTPLGGEKAIASTICTETVKPVGANRAANIVLDILEGMHIPRNQNDAARGGRSVCAGLSAVGSADSLAVTPMVSSFTKAHMRDLRRINEALQKDANFPAGFTYTSMAINEDIQTTAHEDRHNRGPSLATAVGRFQGGDLEIMTAKGWRSYKVHDRYVLFDGSFTHRTSSFVGRRFAVILFDPLRNISCLAWPGEGASRRGVQARGDSS